MEPGFCPKCDTEIADYRYSEGDDNSRTYPFKCRKCNFEGAELYNEVFVGFLNEDEEILK